MVNQILSELVDAGVVSRVDMNDDGEGGYQPARDPDSLTIKCVVDALDKKGTDDIPVGNSQDFEKLSETMKRLSDAMEASPANQRLGDI